MKHDNPSADRDASAKTRTVIRMSGAGLTVGTPVMTPDGQRSVEDLRRGDRVLTKDFGYQTLKCVGFRDVDLRLSDALAPIKFSADCMAHQRPMHDLYLAPSQRLAIRHPLFDPIFGAREVVACAGDLLNLSGVEQVIGLTGVTYVMLGFSRPQLVLTGSVVLDLGTADAESSRLLLSADEAKLACGMLNPQPTSISKTAGLPLH